MLINRSRLALLSLYFIANLIRIANCDQFGSEYRTPSFHLNELDISESVEATDNTGTCPPCFDCKLPNFECKQFSMCNEYTGLCECREGFGGNDCSEPLCGGLSDGQNRRPVRGSDEKSCKCKDGWGGVNCNLCLEDSVCDALLPGGLKGTCYKQGIIVNEFHQMCDVTNKKIVEILDGKKPQVTFSCNKTLEACNFQFWIAENESFYCDLDKCKFEYNLDTNYTHYKCEDARCECIPDKMLCGEAGSIDISDFLTETIRGPGDFSCDVDKKECKFSEPSMNDLITSVFGDPYITLHCASGECMHYSEIPGFDIPGKPKYSWKQLFVIAGSLISVLLVLVASISGIKRSPLFSSVGYISLPGDDDNDGFFDNHAPVTFSFDSVNYTVNGRLILNNSFGIVKPGECLAIMGGSGAGKTTLLDILSAKVKSGEKTANLYVNGEKIKSKQDLQSFQKMIGFVDQEDYLIPTLTVYETVLNSALLRLPRNMSTNSKKMKVLEILKELRINNIKDKVIGSDFERGISGGEKRRVAIACELVTSPSILFLDEPTSGLDAFNAKNVIDCLVRLSHDHERTIIFTIHQPRSNIVAMFDKLILLSQGETVYSGDMLMCNEFFSNIGFKCPPGYNIADYLIDITSWESEVKDFAITSQDEPHVDEENANYDQDIHRVIPTSNSEDDNNTREWAHFAVHRDDYSHPEVARQAQQAAGNGKPVVSNEITAKKKVNLAFKNSLLAEEVLSEIKALNADFEQFQNNSELSFESGGRGNGPVSVFKSKPNYKKAGLLSQLAILSSRTFKNVYRNPKLLLTHYALSIAAALFVGYLYYNVTNDISGFQNRLGLFFFLLTYFGFSTLTGLHSFSIERIVFIRERSNNYYNPLSYYTSKIICDVLPLRVLPPIILAGIIYPLVGLNMNDDSFTKCLLILVLFNLTTAVEILIVGILIKEPGNATLVGVLILLFSLLFAGLFVNQETIPIQIEWLQTLSVFHYGYEALIVNEVQSLILKERKYGLDIQVPGAVILSTFGFDVGALWFDICWLLAMLATFLILGYLSLHYFVYEKR
ncbi:hypothetical protein PACTADRAFT_48714 [Pachysolen tannophilus NRRL Y-2460]|uniref:ABC transporter domain-containing protein n=1 Tax=Pachysolen tannophilus NRRL Y-2460 TaxID=669874 RepID=A0A1E4TYV6_PACTA|nr:hypothetical protein PACTADRAFT_48714 [Pachysolen tannophilus NRRL Y-2460]